MQNSAESFTDILSNNYIPTKVSDGLDSVSTIGPSFNKSKNRHLNCNLRSSISLDKFPICTLSDESLHLFKNLSSEAVINVNDGIDDDLSDIDLIETQHTPSNFKNTSYKKSKRGQKNTVDIECDQLNVEECLLDLDHYLEQMDDDVLNEAGHDLDKNRSMPKGIFSSLRKKSNKKCQFKRDTKLRNTISYTLNKEENELNYATWNNQVPKKIKKSQPKSNTQTRISSKISLDNNREMPQCSTDRNEDELLENNNIRLKLQNEYGNKIPVNDLQTLSDERILQNLIDQQENHTQDIENERPRQFGRRAERSSTLLTSLNTINQNCEHTNYENFRPMSASVIVGASIPDNSSYNGTIRTSRNTSPIPTEISTDSGESLEMSDCSTPETNNNTIVENLQQSNHPIESDNMDQSIKSGFNSYWPYNLSRTLALFSCTLGMLNISRFADLTVNYGVHFLIQFLILSIIFGIPFLWLQMSLGSKIEAGPISMWKISPICVGIGISLTLVQYFTTIYSSVGVAWILVYLRDIFINHLSYPWSESIYHIIPRPPSHNYTNLTESIPDYFNVNVLQRIHIFKTSDRNVMSLQISDRVAFYLAILWAAVFVILCKGLKSFGKIILVLGILPIIFLAAIAVKLFFVIDFSKMQNMISFTEFDEFLVNSKSWAAAAQEVFLTWGFLGVSVIAVSSRTRKNTTKVTLRCDAILVVVLTFIGLTLSALIGLCSIHIIHDSGYIYIPGSYENPEHYSSIFSLKASIRKDLTSYPIKLVPHHSALVGEIYRRSTDYNNVSGYHPLRFITEILPAAVAISAENISWAWTSIIFAMFLAFGLSQLCVMWKPISCALGNSSSSVFLSCVTGLLLSIPFATEIGITLIHYMDVLLGGAWFIPVLWTAEIFGIFLIRGRPYNGDDLVNDLKMSGSVSAFLALSWNVLLPIGLITLAVIEYKTSMSSQFYYWRGKSHFSYWSRKVAALTQIGFLLLVPLSSIIQIYRFLTSGPPDILDRIQMLYRPLNDVGVGMDGIRNSNRNILNMRYDENSTIRHLQNDAPPKYTPPPSYTTATGARLAKILRQSIRRSIRRVLGESEGTRPTIPIQHEAETEHSLYSGENERNTDISGSTGNENRSVNFIYGRSLSLGRKQILSKHRVKEADTSSFPLRTNNFDSVSSNRILQISNSRPYTAEDVITILRSSTLGRRRISHPVNPHTANVFRSVENLVENAELPNISSAIANDYSNQNSTSVI